MSVNIIYILEILQIETKLGQSTGNEPVVIVHSLHSKMFSWEALQAEPWHHQGEQTGAIILDLLAMYVAIGCVI